MKNLILSGGMALFCITAKEIRANASVIVNKILLDGIPALEVHDHLLIIKYHVIDRIKFLRKNESAEAV